MADPPSTTFHKEKVFLCSHPKFIPEVISEFHRSQTIHLLIFFLKLHASGEERELHSLDIQRALAFYLQSTKTIRKTPRFFVTIAERSRDEAMSLQRLSKWIPGCIILCFQLAHITLGEGQGPFHQSASNL